MEATKAFLSRAKATIALKISADVPYMLFFMVFINIFFFSMQQTMVFSFLPKWVRSFGVEEVDVGRYAGLIASAIFIGNCVSSIMWGYISDTLSRMAGVILCGAGCLVTTLAFGFSVNVAWATVTRCLQGVASGQVVVLKALMGDACSKDKLAYGLAVMMTAWALGNTIGPSIGGWTAFPADVYPDVVSKDGIFGRFPALLPNIIIAVGLGMGILLTFMFFPKNLSSQKDETLVLLKKQNNCSYGAAKEKQCKAKAFEGTNASQMSMLMQRLKSSSIIRVLTNKECSILSLLYMLTAIADIGFNEMFPVLASTKPTYKGLGFSPADLGTVLMITFIACMVFQLTLLPRLCYYFGAKRYLIISNLVLVFVIPLLPITAAIESPTLRWGALILILFVNRCCVFAENLGINVLINNCVEPNLLGSANGVTYMAANLGRLIGPLLCGGIYSWSLRNIKGIEGNANALGFPLNQFCTFYVMSGLSVVVAVIAATLDDTIDVRKSTTNGQLDMLG